jgi:hypothetical protein
MRALRGAISTLLLSDQLCDRMYSGLGWCDRVLRFNRATLRWFEANWSPVTGPAVTVNLCCNRDKLVPAKHLCRIWCGSRAYSASQLSEIYMLMKHGLQALLVAGLSALLLLKISGKRLCPLALHHLMHWACQMHNYKLNDAA